MAVLAGAVVLVMGWMAVLRLVVMRFGSPEGLWLALLVHCTVPFYLGGFILFISGTVTLLSGRRMMWWHLTYGAGLLIGGVMAVVAAFLIERFVAHRCIRRHLRVAAASALDPR
jgi:hypothetical protein